MPLIFNGTTIENVVFNGTNIEKLVFNGTVVWEKTPEVETGTYYYFNNVPEVYAIELFDSDSLSGYYSDELIAGGYLENNEGVVVPVLYKTNVADYPGEVDLEDAFFYDSQVTINWAPRDKWRKIELGDDPTFTWDSPDRGYIYTDVVVENNRFKDGILDE